MIASLCTEMTQPQLVGADAGFQAMLPNIRRQAGRRCATCAEARDELVAEIVARAILRLRLGSSPQGRPEIARPTPLVR